MPFQLVQIVLRSPNVTNEEISFVSGVSYVVNYCTHMGADGLRHDLGELERMLMVRITCLMCDA